jgi:hypothetical protein
MAGWLSPARAPLRMASRMSVTSAACDVQVRLDLGEVGKNRDVAVEHDAELAAGGGRVLLGQQHDRGRVADLP